MFNWLKNLFKSTPTYPYSTGALESPIDARNIDLAAVQAPVVIPATYKTNITMLPVDNQQALGICVGEATMKLVQYYIYKKTGKIEDLSARAIYKWCKDVDGNPTMQGTYPSVMAKVITTKGIPLASFAPNYNWLSHYDFCNVQISDEGIKDAATRKLGGYAWAYIDLASIKQAIYQNGVVTGVTDVDTNWFSGIIGKIFSSIGRHNTLWYGYDELGIFGRNSWGTGWFGKLLNYVFGPGEFYFKWEDYKNNVYEVLAYLDIPEKILEDAKNKNYIFYHNLRYGDKGPEVVQLQARLNRELGISLKLDGGFGPATRDALTTYQKREHLVGDAVFGVSTRAKMNGGSVYPVSALYLDKWCNAIKLMEGAKPSRNNPGNLRFNGQQYAVNDNGFCKFDTYEHGYASLKNLLIRAATGKSAVYNPDGDLRAFFHVYAPSSDNNDPDHYANFVAGKIGVPVTIRIRALV